MAKRLLLLLIVGVLILGITGCEDKISQEEKNNSNIDKSQISNENDDVFSWNEITVDGVDEQLLINNMDINMLETIAFELQTLVEEETAEEKEDPQIVITEGWYRIFKKERYKKIIDIGQPAMKPLYFIIYKSPNSGAYEYVCAKALYDLSEFNYDWINSKDFLEKFNKQILDSSK